MKVWGVVIKAVCISVSCFQQGCELHPALEKIVGNEIQLMGGKVVRNRGNQAALLTGICSALTSSTVSVAFQWHLRRSHNLVFLTEVAVSNGRLNMDFSFKIVLGFLIVIAMFGWCCVYCQRACSDPLKRWSQLPQVVMFAKLGFVIYPVAAGILLFSDPYGEATRFFVAAAIGWYLGLGYVRLKPNPPSLFMKE